ncbi:MAG TPA: rhodanese-like domain-containing protein [Aridibacter sp.]|nr:rhodanese-like domain-containing protein [Aridibacter sp.]
MRFSLASFFVLAMAVFTACQTQGPEPLDAARDSSTGDQAPLVSRTPANQAPKMDEHGHVDTASRIEPAEAKKLFDEGEAFFIDTRAADSYLTEHIKDAVNISVDALEQKLKEVPKGKTVIAYCS